MLEFRSNPAPAAPVDDAGLLSACPWCHSAYRGLGMRFLIARDNINLVHVRCPRCAGNVLVLVVASSLGVNSLGLTTDLAHEEVLRFHDAAPVSVDDLLDLHGLLR